MSQAEKYGGGPTIACTERGSRPCSVSQQAFLAASVKRVVRPHLFTERFCIGDTMWIEHEGERYEILYGSDIINDGVYLELNASRPANIDTLLFAFWSYQTRRTTFSAFEKDLPLAVVETFVQEVRRQLPPDGFIPPDENGAA